MTDGEIIRLIIQGDRNMYRILVERYQPLVFRTCMGFLHNKDDADDLTQDVFILFLVNAPTLGSVPLSPCALAFLIPRGLAPR